MQDAISIFYNGNLIKKSHFRAFIYGVGGQKKLVNSWDEFTSCLASDDWYETPEEIKCKKISKSEKKRIEAQKKGKCDLSAAVWKNDVEKTHPFDELNDHVVVF